MCWFYNLVDYGSVTNIFNDYIRFQGVGRSKLFRCRVSEQVSRLNTNLDTFDPVKEDTVTAKMFDLHVARRISIKQRREI